MDKLNNTFCENCDNINRNTWLVIMWVLAPQMNDNIALLFLKVTVKIEVSR